MELADLRAFVTACRCGSLHAAAAQLHLTPSALSKAVKRLEAELRTPLFDRRGKSLVLNADGQRLQQRALALLQLAEDTRAEFHGAGCRVHCRAGGPAMLQWRHAAPMAQALAQQFADSVWVAKPMWEDDALRAMARGELDFAWVTAEALEAPGWREAGVQALPLGGFRIVLAAGRGHPLTQGRRTAVRRVAMERLLAHDFACPTRSLLCGRDRGAGSDGWLLPEGARRIRYWVDDVPVLLALLHAGQALAYLPDFVVQQAGLTRLKVLPQEPVCEEQALLLWRPSQALGWQQQLLRAMGLIAR